jgi:DNA polymerase I-like protein with 3'-5' exonuclease and polymerase domains
VHDETIMEAPAEVAGEVVKGLEEEMQGAAPAGMRVPIVAEGEVKERWTK